jgi:hypothetical protein
MVGRSWEGFVIEMIVQSAPQARNVFFYRDKNQAELDLIVEFSDVRRWAFEIKRSTRPSTSKGNVRAAETIAAERRFLVYPEGASYEMDSGFTVMPLVQACREVAAV